MENYMSERKQPHWKDDSAIQVLLVHIFYLSSEGRGKKMIGLEGGTNFERIPRSRVPFSSVCFKSTDYIKVPRDEMNILLENKMSSLREKTLFKVNIYPGVSYLRMAYFCLYKNMTACLNCWGWILRSRWHGGCWLGDMPGPRSGRFPPWWEPQEHCTCPWLWRHGNTRQKKSLRITDQDPVLQMAELRPERWSAFPKVTQLVSSRNSNFLTSHPGLLDTA